MPLTSSTTVANTDPTAATKAKNATTTAQEQTDRFMKLLVAQLNNQDPMNPMDNAQMTSQIAQINTVSGIQQLNDSINSMSGQFSSMQVMQGSSMIGRQVLADGDSLPLDAKGVGQGAFDLAGDASQVTVQVYSPGGQLLSTETLGAQSSGRHTFSWDGSQYSGKGTPVFKVSASNNGTLVDATTLTRDTVTSVNAGTNGLTVSLAGGATVKYDAIKTIL